MIRILKLFAAMVLASASLFAGVQKASLPPCGASYGEEPYSADLKGIKKALAAPEMIFNPSGKLSKGTKPHQGIPSIAASKNGKRIFATWYGGSWSENTNNYTMTAESTDFGETWSDVILVVRSKFCGDVRLFDASMWRDPDGNIRLFWAQSASGVGVSGGLGRIFDGRAGVWESVCTNPESENPVWTKPRRIANGVMMNQPFILQNGDWLYPIGIFGTPSQIKSDPTLMVGAHCYVSTDGGKSIQWRSGAIPPNNQFPEHMFFQTRNGSVKMLIRRMSSNFTAVNSGGKLKLLFGENNGLVETESCDNGKTWSKIKFSKIPAPSARFHIRRLDSGSLLLVKNFTEEDPAMTEGKIFEPSYKCPRNKICAYISTDDGKTWTKGLVIDDRDCVSYPDATQTSDGTIFIVYDYERHKEQEIYCAKICEADILAGKLVNGKSKLRILVNKGETEYKRPSAEK